MRPTKSWHLKFEGGKKERCINWLNENWQYVNIGEKTKNVLKEILKITLMTYWCYIPLKSEDPFLAITFSKPERGNNPVLQMKNNLNLLARGLHVLFIDQAGTGSGCSAKRDSPSLLPSGLKTLILSGTLTPSASVPGCKHALLPPMRSKNPKLTCLPSSFTFSPISTCFCFFFWSPRVRVVKEELWGERGEEL